MPVKAKPDGYHSVTPYLVVDGVARLIDFLQQTFDAEEVERFAAPGNRIGHAELRIGDSLVMLGDAHGEHKAMQAMLYVYVDDVDASFQRALAAGGSSVQAPTDHFYGDRKRRREGPVRQCLVHRHARRGCVTGRTEAPRARGDAEGGRQLNC